jgi:nickel transport system substrate-binding protein
MTTSAKFYPFLQELTFIRPLRFLSPNAFANGNTSDPYTANSCEPGWGTLESELEGVPSVVCAGIANISGTGPFAFVSREQSVLTSADFKENRVDDSVIFRANQEYWGGVPAIETLQVVRYDSADEIKQALLDQSLDVVWGDAVLPANVVTEIENSNNPNLNVFIGDDIQNVVLLLNTGKPPLDDIRVRKSIIHAINKKFLVKKELGGYLDSVDNVFPLATLI